MQRFLPFSLAALVLVLILGLGLSLSFTPTLAQDDTTPTPEGGEGADTGADTGDDTGGDMGAQPGGPIIIGDPSSPAVQTVLNYFQTFDPNLLAETIQFRDYTQAQGLSTREDVTGPANILNSAFSGQAYNIQRVVTADNVVVVEFTFTGTHSGDFMGAAPTQQTVNVPMVAILELGAGGSDMGAEGDAAAEGDMAAQAGMQIVRFDLYYDASQLAQQLGLSFQAPGAAPGDDTGADAGADTGDDAGADTGADTGGDAGAGTGDDAGADTGDTAGGDAGADTGGDTGADTGDDAGAVSGDASLQVTDQEITADGTVLIAQVTIPVNGWVDIHADSSGAPGEIIGFAQVVAGQTQNVVVPVDTNRVTGTLWAMLHQDAGELGVHEFPGPDTPITDASGNVVVMPFAVTAPATEGG
jgi:hypothetical protein